MTAYRKKWPWYMLGFLSSMFCTVAFVFLSSPPSLSQKIHSIPWEERMAIDSFFRIFLLKGAGAYTLFGDKPASWDSYFDFSAEEVTHLQQRSCVENRQLRLGWEAWEKYQHLFPSPQFLLKAHRLSDTQVEITLIRKDTFQAIIDRHLCDFQSVLGNTLSSSVLLKQYETGKIPLFHLLKKHHGLLGILLGFGKENAWLFYQRDHMTSFSPYDQALQASFLKENQRTCYKFLYLPGFSTNPKSQETQALRQKYLQQQKEIHEAYSHGNFLEITLKRFCTSPLSKT